jgi:hypothetical protein
VKTSAKTNVAQTGDPAVFLSAVQIKISNVSKKTTLMPSVEMPTPAHLQKTLNHGVVLSSHPLDQLKVRQL